MPSVVPQSVCGSFFLVWKRKSLAFQAEDGECVEYVVATCCMCGVFILSLVGRAGLKVLGVLGLPR